MICLCHLMACIDSRMDSHLYSYIYGLVALLDNIESSFSSITISTLEAG